MPETIRMSAAAIRELREALDRAAGAGIAVMTGTVGTQPGLRAIAVALREAAVALNAAEEVGYRA